MKIKTSVTLSQELLEAVDRELLEGQSRSEFIEHALSAFIGEARRRSRDARELAILNREATRLNDEASDVLGYQVVR